MHGAIDLMIAVDAESILATNPSPSLDPDTPTKLDAGTCTLLAPVVYAAHGQATPRLQLNSFGWPHLDWRALSLSANADLGVVIYGLHNRSGRSFVLPAIAIEQTGWLPVPILVNGANHDPPAFAVVRATTYFLRTRIVGKGTGSIDVRFYMTRQNEDGKLIVTGYFEWTATVAVA